jgi:hypothetical protein
MARFMRIEAGVATNAEEWDAPPTIEGVTYVQSDVAHIGDTYDPATGVFTTPPYVPPVPDSVSMMQAQLALEAAGKLDAVTAAVAAADAKTKIYWATATALHRDHPVVLALGAAVGLTPAQIDALFIAAEGLS